ncbi:Conserved_hypothetical protein [Hexamita inflata]|uniref:CRAL-TRIO domain-containing protein n=1 Tax=Hexamita inflata TaxID=28002 RepID=A0ABP1HEE5_9EUKA
MGCGNTNQQAEQEADIQNIWETVQEIPAVAYRSCLSQHFHPEQLVTDFITLCQGQQLKTYYTYDTSAQMPQEEKDMPEFSSASSVNAVNVKNISKIVQTKQDTEQNDLLYLEAVESARGHEASDTNPLRNVLTKRFMNGFKPSTNGMKRTKLQFREVFKLIKQDLPYATESDLFSVYAYLTQPASSTQMSTKAMFVDFKKNGIQLNLIDIRTYLTLHFIMSPEQLRKVIKDPLYILFYGSDCWFNRAVQFPQFMKNVTKHFPTLSKKLVQNFKRDEVIIKKNDFELSIILPLRELIEDNQVVDIIPVFGVESKKIQQFMNAEKEQYKQHLEEIDAQINMFTKQMTGSTTFCIQNRSYGNVVGDEKINIDEIEDM